MNPYQLSQIGNPANLSPGRPMIGPDWRNDKRSEVESIRELMGAQKDLDMETMSSLDGRYNMGKNYIPKNVYMNEFEKKLNSLKSLKSFELNDYAKDQIKNMMDEQSQDARDAFDQKGLIGLRG